MERNKKLLQNTSQKQKVKNNKAAAITKNSFSSQNNIQVEEKNQQNTTIR